MTVVPDYAIYDPDAATLAIVFDGELSESTDISTAGFSAVLTTGKRAIFGAAGVAANNGGIGTLTFGVTEGDEDPCDPFVAYEPPAIPEPDADVVLSLRSSSRGMRVQSGGVIALGARHEGRR